MDIMTMAMCKPKVIDLDKYGINDILLSLNAQGGGTYRGEGFAQFWADVEAINPDILQFSLEALNTVFVCKNVVVFFACSDGSPLGISAETIAMSGGQTMKVSITIVSEETSSGLDGAVIAVRIEPV